MPVSAVGGAVHADLFTGTATTSIPIAVPPGRGGVQPNLALVYNSANGNGWVGLGWKLEKSVIERQTKFGLNYSGDAYTFRLAGINVELVNIGSNQYRAKIEGGFTRVQKLTASDGKPYFLATDKTGQKFYFGRTAATRVANPSDATKIFRWCLDRVEDLDGNYMTISYTGDQGQGYLARIDYTGHGSTRPTNSVIFHLETRPDAVPMYTSHFLMKTAKRLKTIEVRANNRLVRAYKLTYTSSAGTSRSLLRSVTQYGKDATIRSGSITGGSSLPAVTMHYGGETSAGGWRSVPGYRVPRSLAADGYKPGAMGTQFVDLNGDGRMDYVQSRERGGGVINASAFLNTGTGWRSVPGYRVPRSLAADGHKPGAMGTRFVELNGDGRMDYVQSRERGGGVINASAFLNTGTGWRSVPGFRVPRSLAADGHAPGAMGTRFVDLNGDGLMDYVQSRERGGGVINASAFLNTGTGWRSVPGFRVPRSLAADGHAPGAMGTRFVDLNGDGLMDYVQSRERGGGVINASAFLNTGTGWRSVPGFRVPRSLAADGHAPGAMGTRFVDLNGDGLMDYVQSRERGGGVINASAFLNTGTGWRSVPGFRVPRSLAADGHAPGAMGTRFVDLNGDGLMDYVQSRYLGGGRENASAFLNTGTGWRSVPAFKVPYSLESDGYTPGSMGTRFVDLNGDGFMDYVHSRELGGGVIHEGAYLNTSTPVLLKTLTNGLGATTTITYTPSTQYANTQLPYPTQTVASITTNDGNGTTATTTYTYAGGYHHVGEREFRGFHYAKVTGPAGPSGEKTITETWFHQGNDLAVGANNPAVANGYLKGAPYRTKVTDARGNRYSETTTTYTADATGRAPFFTPPASVVIKTCDGNATCRTTRTDYTYDAYGNVTQERQYGDTATTTDDRTVLRTYAANTTKWIVTLPTRETIRAGLGTTGTQLARTDFYYDGTTSCAAASTNQTPSTGHLTRSVRWLSGATTHPETRMAYNSQGNLICTRDANGHTTTTAYDSTGTFVTTVTNAQGHVTTTAYYGVNGVATTRGVYGQVQSVTDANGAVVTTEYDALGRRTKVTQPDGFWTTTSYVSFGTVGSQHVRTDSQLGLSTWTYFDGLGRTTKQQSTGAESSQIITETQYDARGAVTRTSVPYKAGTSTKQWSTSTYDPLGRVVQTTHPDGTRTRACYDDGVTVTLDAKNHKKRTTRDAYGRVTKVEEYTGTFSTCTTARGTPYATTTYAHDRLGNLTTVTDTLGNRTTMAYDTLSRKTSMRDPDLGTWTYAYDRNGNLTRQTDAKGQQTHFRYDALNRRTQKDYGTQKTTGAATADVRYTYDGGVYHRHGRLAQVMDTSGTTRFFYDLAGRVTRTDKIVDGTTYTTRSAYDGLGRVTSLTYPAGQPTGRATRVGTATQFGVNESIPRGLTSHNGKLYMTGDQTNALYTVNATTGVATRVGTATNFGVNEVWPRGLASHNGTLYMLGRRNNALYTVNPTTGRATRVGTATQFGVPPQSARPLLESPIPGLPEDRATRMVTVTHFGVNERWPTGLASYNGKLYMVGQNAVLYTLNPTTGRATRVGTATQFGVNERYPWGLASHKGTLYMVGGSADALYTVNPTTGRATRVGTATRFGGNEAQPTGLASHNRTLYMLGGSTDALYRLTSPPSTITYTYTGPQLQSVQEGSTTYARYSGFNALGQPSTLTLGNGTTTSYTYDSRNYRLKTLRTVKGSTVLQNLGYTFDPAGNVTGMADSKFHVPAQDFYALAAGHRQPRALWTDGTTMWITGGHGSTRDNKLFAYNVATKANVPGATIDLTNENIHPSGLYFYGDTILVSDGVDHKVYAYNKRTKQRWPSREFTMPGASPTGMWSDGTTLWVAAYSHAKLYAYDLRTKARKPGQDFKTLAAGNPQPVGIWSDGTTMWVTNNGGRRVFAYDLATKARRVEHEFEMVQENSLSTGLYSDGKNIWVSDVTDKKVYAYDLTDSRHGTQTFAYDDLNRLTRATGGYGTHTYAYNQIGNRVSHSVPGDQPTGTATRVGTATLFGVNNRWMFGLGSHNGKLYMLGYYPSALYTLNPTTGRATRVGTATNFGVDERNPTGLTSHNGTLYMLGARTDALYRVNPTTGRATRVGTATKFGVNEGVPHGLASHGGKLYMLGDDTDALYTLNPTTGRATRVGTATNFGVNVRPMGLASHHSQLYMTGWDTGALYRVNPTTGVARRVGSATRFGANERYPTGLTSHNGTLYMLGNDAKALYRLPSITTTAYTYNPSGTTSTRPHAVTRAGTNTYSYDANGNMLMGDGRIMTYDNENRLSTVRKNGATTTFVYDGDGGRVKKTVTNGGTTTTTTYVGKLYVCEGTSCSRLIYAGSQRIALVPEPPSGRTASPSYFHPDHLGSTSVLTNAQGVAEEHNSYRPYGQLHTHTGTSDVAYKYTGQERDPSTGLYFYNARYYDPVLGRFISPDTIVESPLHPQTLNRYAYAGNNPVLYNDPTGHCFLVCIIIGAIVGTVAAGIASDWDPGMTLLGGAIGAFSAGVGAKVGGFVATTVKGTAGSILGAAAGGAAAGGTSATLYRAAGYNVNIGLAIGAGAAAGLAGGAVGIGGAELGLNEYAAYFAGAASGGSISSTIMGGDPGEGALYAVAAAGIALGVQYANYKLQEYQASKTTQAQMQSSSINGAKAVLVSGEVKPQITSKVFKSTIRVDENGVLSFDVKTSGIRAGGFLGGRIETGSLPMTLSGQDRVNFRTFAWFPRNTIRANGLVSISIPIGGIQGPAYLRIIPDYLYGQAPPGFAGTNNGPGAFGPCRGAIGCGVSQNYDQPY